jgi:hypothetical protein
LNEAKGTTEVRVCASTMLCCSIDSHQSENSDFQSLPVGQIRLIRSLGLADNTPRCRTIDVDLFRLRWGMGLRSPATRRRTYGSSVYGIYLKRPTLFCQALQQLVYESEIIGVCVPGGLPGKMVQTLTLVFMQVIEKKRANTPVI